MICLRVIVRSYFQNSCFVFHRGIQTPRNNKSTRPAASCFHLFLGVWIPRWNTRSRFGNSTYKLYIISCFNQSYIAPPELIKDRNGGYCLARELRSASGHDFTRRSLLYSALILLFFQRSRPLLLVAFTSFLGFSCLDCSVLRFFSNAKIVDDTSLIFFPVEDIVQNWQLSLVVT